MFEKFPSLRRIPRIATAIGSLQSLEACIAEGDKHYVPTVSLQDHIDPSGEWGGFESIQDGELARQRGEIRVRIVKIDEAFVGSHFLNEEMLALTVQSAAERWNEVLQDIDPMVSFKVDPTAMEADCSQLSPFEISNGEVWVCIPNGDTWVQWQYDTTRMNIFSKGFGSTNAHAFTSSIAREDEEDAKVYISGAIVRIKQSAPGVMGTYAPEDGENFMEDVITHELGHTLGLADLSPEATGLMKASGNLSHPLGEIDAGTIEGLKEIYNN